MTLNNIAAAPSTTFPQGALGEDVVVGDGDLVDDGLGAKLVEDDAFLARECIYDFLFL
jgi:hypothetical protein